MDRRKVIMNSKKLQKKDAKFHTYEILHPINKLVREKYSRQLFFGMCFPFVFSTFFCSWFISCRSSSCRWFSRWLSGCLLSRSRSRCCSCLCKHSSCEDESERCCC